MATKTGWGMIAIALLLTLCLANASYADSTTSNSVTVTVDHINQLSIAGGDITLEDNASDCRRRS